MLARMTAMMPPAEAWPILNSSERLLVDEEGQVGGGVAGAAIGGDQDLGIDGEQEDRLDQDHHGDRARQMRQRQVPEAAEEAGAVHLGRLLLLAVERLQRGEQDQRREGQPLPGDDDDDREQRILREPVDRLQAEEARRCRRRRRSPDA